MSENEKPGDAGSRQSASNDVVEVVEAEVDPHGATVVAAVGTEDGVQAVAAMDTDYFNTVLAAEFADPGVAQTAYMALLDAERPGSAADRWRARRARRWRRQDHTSTSSPSTAPSPA